jgi:hypothetical protein
MRPNDGDAKFARFWGAPLRGETLRWEVIENGMEPIRTFLVNNFFMVCGLWVYAP